MTIELLCLAVLGLLAASLWIPYIIGVNMMPRPAGAPDVFVVPPDPLDNAPWIARSYRAHQNLLEQLLPFAVLILIAAILGVSTAITRGAAIAFVVIRVCHAVGMITATARLPLRPLIFTSGYIAIIVIGWQVLRHAPLAA